MPDTEFDPNFIIIIDPAMSVEEIIEAIIQDATDFADGAEQYDDMTVVVVKTIRF